MRLFLTTDGRGGLGPCDCPTCYVYGCQLCATLGCVQHFSDQGVLA